VAPLSAYDFLGLRSGHKTAKSFSRRDVGERSALGFAAFPLAEVRRCRQVRELLALTGANNEQARTELGYAVVRSVQYLPGVVVTSRFDLSKQSGEGRSARAVVKGEGVDVLEDEVARPDLCKDTCVGLQQAGCRVNAVTLPIQPKARLGERYARWTADEEIGTLTARESSGAPDVLGAEALSGAGRQRKEVCPQHLLKLREVAIRVLLHGVDSVVVPLDRGERAVTRGLDTQVQTASAGKQRDRGTDGHRPILSGVRIAVAHPDVEQSLLDWCAHDEPPFA
jgi:hypothetical protein